MKDHIATTGRVLLVGAGPGDPDLLTVKALRIIREAAIIVHDRLVSPEILALAPRDAQMIDVGKTPRRHPVPQERINGLLVDLALEGRDVVRLKGGDPFIFGRGGEEMEALRAAGVAVEVVPGITAAQAASASTRVPLTQRGMVTGLRYVTGPLPGGRAARSRLGWSRRSRDDAGGLHGRGQHGRDLDAADRARDAGRPAGAGGVRRDDAARDASGLAARCDRSAMLPEAELAAPVLFIIGRVVDLHRTATVEDIVAPGSAPRIGSCLIAVAGASVAGGGVRLRGRGRPGSRGLAGEPGAAGLRVVSRADARAAGSGRTSGPTALARDAGRRAGRGHPRRASRNRDAALATAAHRRPTPPGSRNIF